MDRTRSGPSAVSPDARPGEKDAERMDERGLSPCGGILSYTVTVRMVDMGPLNGYTSI
ncbi:MAG: hypothetical protein IPI00_07790 [Flavobacteriales bacterium]|nr:hypothetical protein [Flavobacteriales bacterium]MBK7240067.1 hypothetical protein [Flavobacteriales bacterium]MBK7297121.1 hypothetical protein [Flavobacteriales bacterium]MBK9535611.1 hypothetical protein [Flavobacteriales bacterium]MBP9138685.1 hypothetical protein [Flavobacteriales bacterium]